MIYVGTKLWKENKTCNSVVDFCLTCCEQDDILMPNEWLKNDIGPFSFTCLSLFGGE